MDEKILLQEAIKAKDNAYAPYSMFKVGAAVLTDIGKIYKGSNIENASYGATNCAERTAVFKAVSEGERKIRKIAVVSDNEEIIFPCGICRQVITEFSDRDTQVICGNNNGKYEVYMLNDLIPKAFRLT